MKCLCRCLTSAYPLIIWHRFCVLHYRKMAQKSLALRFYLPIFMMACAMTWSICFHFIFSRYQIFWPHRQRTSQLYSTNCRNCILGGWHNTMGETQESEKEITDRRCLARPVLYTLKEKCSLWLHEYWICICTRWMNCWVTDLFSMRMHSVICIKTAWACHIGV